MELRVTHWDDLLRSCDLDFFVTETSTLEVDQDSAVEPMSSHPVSFEARQDRSARPAPATPGPPSITCNSLSTVKGIVARPDAVTALTLSCVPALNSDRHVGVAGDLHTHYGMVSLKDRPMTEATEKIWDTDSATCDSVGAAPPSPSRTRIAGGS